ncbi:hypothetical protein FBU30_007667 [Linnemannia zychae]|nr:hypothetical protein FBU30_007667 [Linnemannia zychae]
MRSTSLTLSAALFLLFTTIPSFTQASITCSSPSSGSVQAGSSITLRWGDSGTFPKSEDVYSADAIITCSSGEEIARVSGFSNGQSWTVPRDVLGGCSSRVLDVEFEGTHYDLFHWLHSYQFSASCGSVQVEPIPVTTTTTTTTTEPITTTTSNAVTTTSASTIVTSASTPILSPTLPATTANGTLPSAIIPSATGPNSVITPIVGSSDDPSATSSSSTSSGSASKSGGPSKAALGALGVIGGLAVIGVLVFGLILVKRRQRHRARKQRWENHNYSSTSMSDNGGQGKGNYAFGPGTGRTAGLSYLEHQDDGYIAYHSPEKGSTSSSNHVHSMEYVVPFPAPPADEREEKERDHKTQQQAMSATPPRPPRTYQGDFDDPTPWDGQLGYLQPHYPTHTQGQGHDNTNARYKNVQNYLTLDLPPQEDLQSDFNDNDNDTSNSRVISMRASSQFPADMEYFARLRETSWPLPPTLALSTSPTSSTSPTRRSQIQRQSSTTATIVSEAGLGPSSSPTQMPYLISLARSLSHSGAHQYDFDENEGNNNGSILINTACGGNQLTTLKHSDVAYDCGLDTGILVSSESVKGSPTTVVAAAADEMLSLRHSFEKSS